MWGTQVCLKPPFRLCPPLQPNNSYCLAFIVQWKHGSSHAQGVAAEIKTQPGEKVQIESKKGNTVTRNADPANPAVLVERHGDGNNQDVVKKQSELTRIGEGDADANGEEDEEVLGEGGKTEENIEKGEEKEPGVGEKRGRETAKRVQAGEEEKYVEEAENSEKAKKAKLDKEGEEKEKEKEKEEGTGEQPPAPTTKSARGKGRGRAKTTAATTTPKRTSGRTKKGTATAGTKKKAAAAGEEEKAKSTVEGVKEVVMGEAIPDAPGEIEKGTYVTIEAPTGQHAPSKELGAGAPPHN
jgi:hypothetical protein